MGWKSIIKSVAPTLATALGGPLAGAATSAIAGALLPDDKVKTLANSPEKLARAVERAVQGATPEQLAALKKVDADFEISMTELGVDLERIAADDRNSARKREEKVGGWANPLLAGLIVGGFLAMVGYILIRGMPETASLGLIGTCIGYVSAKADQAVSYYFGSSSSSAQKNVLLARGKS